MHGGTLPGPTGIIFEKLAGPDRAWSQYHALNPIAERIIGVIAETATAIRAQAHAPPGVCVTTILTKRLSDQLSCR